MVPIWIVWRFSVVVVYVVCTFVLFCLRVIVCFDLEFVLMVVFVGFYAG